MGQIGHTGETGEVGEVGEPMTCPECLGAGYIVCVTCDGEGSVESKGDADD